MFYSVIVGYCNSLIIEIYFYFSTRKKEKAEADIHISKGIIKDLETKIKKLNEDEIQMKTKLHNIRQSLTEKRTAYAETTERSRPIQYILNLKDKGEIKGLLGRCVSNI